MQSINIWSSKLIIKHIDWKYLQQLSLDYEQSKLYEDIYSLNIRINNIINSIINSIKYLVLKRSFLIYYKNY